MQISTPIVHLEKEGSSTYHVHVITWFDQTKFKAEGHDTIPTTATDNTFTITLYVTEDINVPNMQLLTPVVHTLTLTGVTLSGTDPFIIIKINNIIEEAEISRKKMHKDSAGNSAMPDPGGKPYNY